MSMQRDEKMVVALTGCSHALTHGYLLIYPTVLLLLQKEFSLGFFQLGLIGNIMTFCYGLGALPGGLIYNYLGPKRLFLFCFLGSSLAVILAGMSNSLIFFATGLALLGSLGSVYHPLANALITAKVYEFGRALGIHGATGNIGLALAPFVIGLIASSLGWRYAFLLSAVPGLLLSVWSLFVDMSVTKGEGLTSLSSSEEGTPFKKVKAFFSLPLVLLYLVNMMQSFASFGSLTFLPTYLSKRTSFQLLSLDPVALGGILSALVLATGGLGQYMGGILAQRPHLRRSLLMVSALSVPCILVMSFVTHFSLMAIALVFFFLNFSLQPLCNTLVARATAPGMRGTAFGVYFFLSFAFGSLASSFCGLIAETFELRWVFMGLSSSVLLLTFFAWMLNRVHMKTPE